MDKAIASSSLSPAVKAPMLLNTNLVGFNTIVIR